jgi:hypothetical protein
VLAALTTPWLLWAGLGAVALPILIHLLARRRFRRVRWAAIEFLREAQKENRRRMRIRELILLAMRCLAMVLLGLLLARPFLSPEGFASTLGSATRTRHLFILDDSYSMGLTRGRDSVFRQAADAIIRDVRALAAAPQGVSVAVMRASDPAAPLLAAAPLDEVSVAALIESLEALAVSNRPADWDGAVAAAADWVASEAGPADRITVYVLSDFQRRDWTPADPTARFQPLRALAETGRSVGLAMTDLGRDDAENLLIADLEIGDRQVVAGLSTRVTATIANYGPAESQPGQLEMFIDDAATPSAPLPAIAPGQSVTVPLQVTFAEPGPHALSVTLPGDALPIDDVRYLACEAVPAMRVLLVNGEPSADPYDDEVHLISTALRPEGAVFSGIEVQTIEDHALSTADLERVPLMIWANVYRPDPSMIDRLERYVADGGGLVIFLGDQVDGQRYNDLLYRVGDGPLPASIDGVVSSPPDRPGVTLAPIETDHPALRVFAGDENPFAQGIHFWTYATLTPAIETPVASAPATTQPADRGPARVVLRFADDSRSPAWVERSFGDGRVILLATSADNEWSDWPASPSYLVTLLELVQYACRSGEWREDAVVGSPLHWRHRADREVAAAAVRTPGYPADPAEIIQAGGGSDDARLTYTWERTDRPGVYRLMATAHDGESIERPRAVNVDAQEGDLRHVSRDRLMAMTGGLTTEFRSPDEDISPADAPAGREMWPIVLVVALGLLMIEQFLGWYFGRVR